MHKESEPTVTSATGTSITRVKTNAIMEFGNFGSASSSDFDEASEVQGHRDTPRLNWLLTGYCA